MTSDDTFGIRLAQARAEKKLSQSELAELTGIAPAQISRYESGRNMPRPGIVAKLAKALSVSMHWLNTGAFPWGDERGPEIRIRLSEPVHALMADAAEEANRPIADEVAARVEASLDQKTQPALLASLAHLNVKLAEKELDLHEQQLNAAALAMCLRHACDKLSQFISVDNPDLARYRTEAQKYDLDLDKFRLASERKVRALELRQNELFDVERKLYPLPATKATLPPSAPWPDPTPPKKRASQKKT